MKKLALVVMAIAVGAVGFGVRAGEKVTIDKLPKAVTNAVKKRFPRAEMKDGSKDTADGKTTYEVSIKEAGKGIDVSLTADGVITLIEKELAFKDLPKKVADTFTAKYPGATYKIVEEVIKVKDGKEATDYFEAIVVAADKTEYEAEVAPDGKFLKETKKEPPKPEPKGGKVPEKKG
ncbi:MAG: hypothetical protein U0746_18685 [Gemmataceae bacterium]